MIQVQLRDRSNNVVKILTGAKNAAYHNVLNSDGSGTFLIHRADADVTTYSMLTGGIDGYIVHLLRKGPLETAFTDRFAFVVEAVQLAIGQQEDAGAWIHVSGRGTLCLLEDRTVWPPGFDGTNASSISNQWQIYAGAPGGAIMAGEIDRSNPRFALQLTHSLDSGTAYRQPVLADAPTGWWRLDDTGTTALDLGSGNHPGTLNGGVTTGKPGALSPDPNTAMSFDGTTGYISIAAPPQLGTAAWSLEAWVNPTAFSGSAAMIALINGTGVGNGYGFSVGLGGGGTHLMALFQGVAAVDSGYAFPTAKVWYHVVVTYDNTNIRFYVNGALKATVAQAPPTAPTGGAFIGKDTTGRFFNGQIDEAAIYPTTLSLARIQAHFNAGSTYYQPVSQTTVPQTVKLRFDNLRLLHDGLASAGPMEAQMVGIDYQAFNQIGSDKSATVTIKMASRDSLLGVTLERDSRPVKNWVVAQGTGEGLNTLLAVSSDAPSIASLRRREGFQDARQVDNQGQLALTAAGAISQYKAVDQRITVRFFDSPHTQIYSDFGLGDTIGLAVAPINFLSKYRVMGISVADVDAEHEECSLDLNDMRTEYLVKLLKGVVSPTVSSLNILNRMPQGSQWNDSMTYPDNCGPGFPFHFDLYVPKNVLQLNYALLSFKLRAFRDYNSFSATATAGESGHSHSHSHQMFGWNSNGAAPGASSDWVDGAGTHATFAMTANPPTVLTSSANANGSSGHTHAVSITSVLGIYEGIVATGVTVIINGTDRTAALGGGSGFTTDQTELAITPAWLNIGAWNLIDLTPSGLGRIIGHLLVTGYSQSV